MKKLAAHVTFFYKEDRLKWLEEVVAGLLAIRKDDVDIFIHTNQQFSIDGAKTVVHNLDGIHPHKLAWLSRPMLAKQLGKYQHYMYIEDDVLFTKTNFDYYLKYHSICKQANAYLGFLRTERSKDGSIRILDCLQPLTATERVGNVEFLDCSTYRYAALWLLDAEEMDNYVNSMHDLFMLEKRHYKGPNMIREDAAIGPIYDMFSKMLVLDQSGCYVQHLPSNYADTSSRFGKIRIDNFVQIQRKA